MFLVHQFCLFASGSVLSVLPTILMSVVGVCYLSICSTYSLTDTNVSLERVIVLKNMDDWMIKGYRLPELKLDVEKLIEFCQNKESQAYAECKCNIGRRGNHFWRKPLKAEKIDNKEVIVLDTKDLRVKDLKHTFYS